MFTIIGPRGQWCWSQLMVEDGFNPCSTVGSWEGRLLRAGLTKGYPAASAWWWAGAKGECGLKQTSHSWAGQPASKKEAGRWRQEMAVQSVPWEKENRRWADYIWPKEKKKKGFLNFFWPELWDWFLCWGNVGTRLNKFGLCLDVGCIFAAKAQRFQCDRLCPAVGGGESSGPCNHVSGELCSRGCKWIVYIFIEPWLVSQNPKIQSAMSWTSAALCFQELSSSFVTQ